MKKILLIFITLVIMLPFVHAFATLRPRPLITDSRIKVVTYQKGNVVPIYGASFVTTQILFGDDEQVIDIEGGDMGGWTTDVPPATRNMIFVKPTVSDSDTNMTVVTNRHTYYFHLMSNKTDSPTYAVRFIYPMEQKTRLLRELNFKKQQDDALFNHSKDPQDYNWNYSFNGARRIVPLHVFDDGRFTYMEIRPGQSIPAIFAVDNRKGGESVVNFRKKGQYIIIQRVSPQFTLREGKNIVASIFNNILIENLLRYG